MLWILIFTDIIFATIVFDPLYFKIAIASWLMKFALLIDVSINNIRISPQILIALFSNQYFGAMFSFEIDGHLCSCSRSGCNQLESASGAEVLLLTWSFKSGLTLLSSLLRVKISVNTRFKPVGLLLRANPGNCLAD